MQITVYNAFIEPMVKTLGQLEKIIDKGVLHATPKRDGITALMQDKLVFDMFSFVRQIRIACDNAKGAAARLSGTPIPVFEDTETTPEELKARIQKTIAFITSIDPKKYDGREEEMVELPAYFGGKKMIGFEYLTHYGFPNFMFHATIAYAILRKNGVDVGKGDFLGELPLK